MADRTPAVVVVETDGVSVDVVVKQVVSKIDIVSPPPKVEVVDIGNLGRPGPKGDKGDTGAQGPKGDKGDQGDPGTGGGGGGTDLVPSWIWQNYTLPQKFSVAAGEAANLPIYTNDKISGEHTVLPDGWVVNEYDSLIVPEGVYSVFWYMEDKINFEEAVWNGSYITLAAMPIGHPEYGTGLYPTPVWPVTQDGSMYWTSVTAVCPLIQDSYIGFYANRSAATDGHLASIVTVTRLGSWR
jgi:hypothetical protein